MVGGWRIAVVLAVLAVSLPGAPAWAQTRLALVIGNSNYRAVTPLPNPVNDAKAVADDLKSAAFDVTQALDVGQADMRRAIKDFAAKVAAKGTDTIALVYYAGHGVQVDGENFLVPVDAKIQSEADIAKEAVRLADVMSALAAVPSKMRIVILDACRNNPFATTKQTRGLAIVDAPTGSIVAYSTAPGTEATDGAGAHSPYTAAFIEVAQQPRLQIEQLFKQVRLKVHEATKGQQTPWESSSLTSDFWFLPTNESPSAAVVASVPAATTARQPARPPRPTAPQVATVRSQAPSVADQTAQPPQTAPATDIAQTPPAPAPQPQVAANAPLPPPRPAPLQASAPSPTLPPPQPSSYASAPPQPPAAPVADLRAMSPDDAYEFAVMEDSVPAYEEFLLVYPNDPRSEWVRTTLALRVDAIAWRYASVVNTPDAYAAYVARYPGGIYVDEAVRLRMRPRLRPIDVVIAPRFIAPPPAPRIALPLIQMRRTASAPIVLPMVYSRPGRFNPSSRLAPAHQLPSFNPAVGTRFNAATATTGPNGHPRERMVNPNLAPPGLQRSNAVNVPSSSSTAPVYRPVRPLNAQVGGGQQRVQLGPKAKGPPPEKCAGRGCRH